jgi:hypothetical protein
MDGRAAPEDMLVVLAIAGSLTAIFAPLTAGRYGS